ncbi:hypothetical protein AYK20_09555 [Thermoplasmatales archaeon SG8-52-1]|nr:MAG: hypothetical protein AYK20_09555 [Thermoplasmatales archaeon SG8-52-1]
MLQKKLPILNISNENGRVQRFKIPVITELNITFEKVNKNGKIFPANKLPFDIVRKLRDEVKQGKMKKQVAEELGISIKSVTRYTKDITKNKKISDHLIKTIRTEVKRCKSKTKAARILNIPYDTVVYYTRDISVKKKITKRQKEIMNKEILSGKSRYQVAKDLNLSYNAVRKYTKYLPNTRYNEGYPGIRGKSLRILEVLITKGYYICTQGDTRKYRLLKKYFPMICKVNMYSKTIVFLEDKSDIAIRGFLEHINKRKISYMELEEMSKIFKSKLSKSEKKKYVCTF